MDLGSWKKGLRRKDMNFGLLFGPLLYPVHTHVWSCAAKYSVHSLVSCIEKAHAFWVDTDLLSLLIHMKIQLSLGIINSLVASNGQREILIMTALVSFLATLQDISEDSSSYVQSRYILIAAWWLYWQLSDSSRALIILKRILNHEFKLLVSLQTWILSWRTHQPMLGSVTLRQEQRSH